MRTTFILACVTAAVSACASYQPPSLPDGQTDSNARIASFDPPSLAGVTPPTYGLSLSMEDGGSQTIDVQNPTFFEGERVWVTPEGSVEGV